MRCESRTSYRDRNTQNEMFIKFIKNLIMGMGQMDK